MARSFALLAPYTLSHSHLLLPCPKSCSKSTLQKYCVILLEVSQNAQQLRLLAKLNMAFNICICVVFVFKDSTV